MDSIGAILFLKNFGLSLTLLSNWKLVLLQHQTVRYLFIVSKYLPYSLHLPTGRRYLFSKEPSPILNLCFLKHLLQDKLCLLGQTLCFEWLNGFSTIFFQFEVCLINVLYYLPCNRCQQSNKTPHVVEMIWSRKDLCLLKLQSLNTLFLSTQTSFSLEQLLMKWYRWDFQFFKGQMSRFTFGDEEELAAL